VRSDHVVHTTLKNAVLGCSHDVALTSRRRRIIWRVVCLVGLISTRRMAIANGTCVNFCNQPKAHFGLPWVRPWDNRSKCYMERGFNAGQTHSSIYTSIFNRLRAIARYWSEIATFFLPLAFNAPVGCSYWNSEKSLVLRKLESVKTV